MSEIKQITFNSIVKNYNLNPVINNAEAFAVSGFYGVNTVYNVDARNNRLYFIEFDTISTIRSITVPVGNYTITSLITQINTSMTAAGTNVYTLTNNTLINIITITAATKTFNLVAGPNDLYYELGFDSSVFTTNVALTAVATNTFDMSGLKCLNIISSSFGTGVNVICGINKSVLASIPINVPYLGVISYIPPIQFITSQISSLSNLDLIFTDERLRIITLNSGYILTLLLRIE